MCLISAFSVTIFLSVICLNTGINCEEQDDFPDSPSTHFDINGTTQIESSPADSIIHKQAKIDPSWNEVAWKLYQSTKRKTTLQYFTEHWIPIMSASIPTSNLSKKCERSLATFVKGFQNKEPWAEDMVDSWGKPSTDHKPMVYSYFGSFDKCLAITVPQNDEDNTIVKGKYCPVTIVVESKITRDDTKESDRLPNFMIQPLAFFGACFPSACTENDVTNFLTQVFSPGTQVRVSLCSVDSSLQSWRTDHLAVVFILAIFGVLMCLATAVDVYVIHLQKKSIAKTKTDKTLNLVSHSNSHERVFQALLCFSVYSNTKRIFDTSNANNLHLNALGGIRFVSTLWVILGHTYAFIYIRPHIVSNQGYFTNAINSLETQIVPSGMLAVDTFFFISGLLVAYISLPKLAALTIENKRLNIVMFYFHRYLRLTPPVGMMIAVTILMERFGSGPVWNNEKQEGCRRYWWATIFHVNFKLPIKTEQWCLMHTWSLSNEFQFYLLSPFLLMLLTRNWRIGVTVIVLLIFGSSCIIGVISLIKNYPPVPFFVSVTLKPYNVIAHGNDIYMRSYCRIGPYCIGILTGYLLYKHSNSIKLTTRMQIFGWLSAMIIFLTMMFFPFKWYQGADFDNVHSLLFGALHRTLWAVGIAWIVVSCATGHGGIVNEILSWKGFIPLNRLSYMVFLVHTVIMDHIYDTVKAPLHLSHFFGVRLFFEFVLLSYFFGFICSLAFEVPFLRIEKIFTHSHPKKSIQENGKLQNHENTENCCSSQYKNNECVTGGKKQL